MTRESSGISNANLSRRIWPGEVVGGFGPLTGTDVAPTLPKHIGVITELS